MAFHILTLDINSDEFWSLTPKNAIQIKIEITGIFVFKINSYYSSVSKIVLGLRECRSKLLRKLTVNWNQKWWIHKKVYHVI